MSIPVPPAIVAPAVVGQNGAQLKVEDLLKLANPNTAGQLSEAIRALSTRNNDKNQPLANYLDTIVEKYRASTSGLLNWQVAQTGSSTDPEFLELKNNLATQKKAMQEAKSAYDKAQKDLEQNEGALAKARIQKDLAEAAAQNAQLEVDNAQRYVDYNKGRVERAGKNKAAATAATAAVIKTKGVLEKAKQAKIAADAKTPGAVGAVTALEAKRGLLEQRCNEARDKWNNARNDVTNTENAMLEKGGPADIDQILNERSEALNAARTRQTTAITNKQNNEDALADLEGVRIKLDRAAQNAGNQIGLANTPEGILKAQAGQMRAQQALNGFPTLQSGLQVDGEWLARVLEAANGEVNYLQDLLNTANNAKQAKIQEFQGIEASNNAMVQNASTAIYQWGYDRAGELIAIREQIDAQRRSGADVLREKLDQASVALSIPILADSLGNLFGAKVLSDKNRALLDKVWAGIAVTNQVVGVIQQVAPHALDIFATKVGAKPEVTQTMNVLMVGVTNDLFNHKDLTSAQREQDLLAIAHLEGMFRITNRRAGTTQLSGGDFDFSAFINQGNFDVTAFNPITGKSETANIRVLDYGAKATKIAHELNKVWDDNGGNPTAQQILARMDQLNKPPNEKGTGGSNAWKLGIGWQTLYNSYYKLVYPNAKKAPDGSLLPEHAPTKTAINNRSKKPDYSLAPEQVVAFQQTTTDQSGRYTQQPLSPEQTERLKITQKNAVKLAVPHPNA